MEYDPPLALFDPVWVQDLLPQPSGIQLPQSSDSHSGELPARIGAETEQPEKRKRGRRPKESSTQVTTAAQARQMEMEVHAKLQALQQLQSAHQELSDKAWVLEQVMEVHEDAAKRLQQAQLGVLPATNPFECIGMTVQEVSGASLQEVLDVLKTLQSKLGEELLKADSTGVPTDELKRLGSGMLEGTKYAYVYRPDLVMFNSMHVDSLLEGEAGFMGAAAMPSAPAEHWHRVAKSVGAGPQALTRCVILSGLIQGWLDRIHSERTALSKALQSCTAHAPSFRWSHPSQPGSSIPTPMVDSYAVGMPAESPEEGIVKRLQANVEKERNILWLVTEILYTRILNEMEGCRALVHSYPWMPDDLCLMKELATLAPRPTKKTSSMISQT